jgi:AmmeMemoRadiSam system protein B
MEDWETPLGIVKNDVEFQKVASKFLPGDERPHNREHSIEVQIPFLQYIMAGKADDNFKIAPIIASPDIDYKEIADAIFNTIKKAKRNVMIIASSDFTHYGFNYGYLPFTRNAKENMQKLDMGAIEKIEKLDAIGFLEYTDKTGATICGKYPIAVLIELCKKLGAKKASLLKYYTSGDVTGDYSSAVGYASIMIS